MTGAAFSQGGRGLLLYFHRDHVNNWSEDSAGHFIRQSLSEGRFPVPRGPEARRSSTNAANSKRQSAARRRGGRASELYGDASAQSVHPDAEGATLQLAENEGIIAGPAPTAGEKTAWQESDHKQQLCFATALWNGRDPILKERLFGLTNSEANHGEDVKEYYCHLDSTPALLHEILVQVSAARIPLSRPGRDEPAAVQGRVRV